MCQNKIGRKITKKNPNVQIKFILFCHLQDFFTVISVGALREDRSYKKNDIRKRARHFLEKKCFLCLFLYNRIPSTLYSTPFLRITICPSRKTF